MFCANLSRNRDPNLQFVEQPALQPPEFVINQADQQVSCHYAPAFDIFLNIHVNSRSVTYPLNRGSSVGAITENVALSLTRIHFLSTARGAPEF